MGLHKNQTNSGSFKKELVPWNKGKKKWTVGTKVGFQKGNKLGNKFTKGHKLYNHPSVIKHQFKDGESHHNLPHSEITKRKISAFYQNINVDDWKKFITPSTLKIRRAMEYIYWRKAVLERDNYTCQNCKVNGGSLHTHHIKPFSKYPELRTNINNGITLCEECHKLIHYFMIKKLKGGNK